MSSSCLYHHYLAIVLPALLLACTLMQAHGEFLYIAFLAVDPSRQNQGLGSILLSHILKIADQNQCWSYLEASNPRNAKLYERCDTADLVCIPLA